MMGRGETCESKKMCSSTAEERARRAVLITLSVLKFTSSYWNDFWRAQDHNNRNDIVIPDGRGGTVQFNQTDLPEVGLILSLLLSRTGCQSTVSEVLSQLPSLMEKTATDLIGDGNELDLARSVFLGIMVEKAKEEANKRAETLRMPLPISCRG